MAVNEKLFSSTSAKKRKEETTIYSSDKDTPPGRRYLQELLLLGDGGQVSDTEVSLLRAAADAEAAVGLHHVTVQQPDGFVGRGGRVVFGVGEAAILPAEVHHEPELPEGPRRAEQGDEPVLVGVPGDLADEDLAAGSRGGPEPH